MKNYFALTALVLSIFSCTTALAQLSILDAPHNPNNSTQKIYCRSCHSYSIWWEFSPTSTIADRETTLIEPLCFSCHNPTNAITGNISTHSSTALGFMHRDDLADWTRNCLDCHDPHFQGQLYWQDDATVQANDLFVVTGTISPGSIQVNTNGTSSFQYTVNSYKSPRWEDHSTWTDKTGIQETDPTAPGRGLILALRYTSPLPDSFITEDSFEVIEVDTPTAGVITVSGSIDDTIYDGLDFGLLYGQLIKNSIAVDPDKNGTKTDADVKFFDANGGFVTDTLEGLCQVCHADGSMDQTLGTRHFQYNNWPDSHINIKGTNAAATLNCMDCHFHDRSFGHGIDGSGPSCSTNGCHDNTNSDGSTAKHVEHLEIEIACSSCHDLANMRDPQTGEVLLDENTTTVCADRCHHDGTDLDPSDGNNAPAVDTFVAGWGNPSYVFPNDCQGCHAMPPDYITGAPKGNSHQKHTAEGFTCDYCHYSTTPDNGNSLSSPNTHANLAYDIVPNPALAITLNYTYNPTGSTCSINNNACHNGVEATWGNTLTCENCHISIPTVDESQANVLINLAEWTTTGHGRPATSTYDGSNNPGADLTCFYCHSETVPHNDPTNPFKLVNISSVEDGMNGVCWVCHKTGSLGYNPPGMPLINSTNASKVDSYHESLPGAGGQFCWDCHDPHGDSNIVMIHNQVATNSDNITGEPLSFSSDVVFTDMTTGSDYAKTENTLDASGTYNGICNVCHTATLSYRPFHYTSTYGDVNHYQDQRCTNCHHHTGNTKKQAFSEGDCLDCHNTPQPVNSPTRRAISTEFPAPTESPAGAAHAHFGADLDFMDCRVCHDYTDHMSGQIVLIDADWDVLYRGSDVNSLVAINTVEFQFDDISDFCMSCHDADGATRLPEPMNPFGNGNAPPNVADKFKGTLNVAEFYGDTYTGTMGSGRMVLSHHPLSSDDQNDLGGVKLECTNCHGSHSASLTTKLANPDPDPDGTHKTWTGSNNGFCLTCHDGGMSPKQPDFPTGVVGPTYVPFYAPGSSCDSDQNPLTLEVFDCSDKCIPKLAALAVVGDGYCDDGYQYTSLDNDFDLRCDGFDGTENLFNNDGGDCGPLSLEGGYSYLSGINTCNSSYSQSPWLVKMKWDDAPHGGGSKRNWPGYIQSPEVPSYELECITCHDSHGSWTPTHPTGNPYMIKDYIDGSPYADDGYHDPLSKRLGCTDDGSGSVTCEQYGTSGSVVIQTPSHNGNPQDYLAWSGFCSKCHKNWQTPQNAIVHGRIDAEGNPLSAGSYASCLSCHAHGALWGNQDWNSNDRYEGAPNDNAPWCP